MDIKYLTRVANKVSNNKLLAMMILLYLVSFCFLSFARHDGLKTQMNDLGNMEQPIFNTLNGDFLFSSNYINSDKYEINRLGIHANFILLLLLPVYYFFQTPKTLLMIQTLIITLGAVPLYLLGKRLLGVKSRLSLVGPLIYLINPTIQDTNMYDFHPLAIAMPLLIFAFYFLYTRKYLGFYFFSFLVMLCKEDMPLIIFMFGLYMILAMRERKRGILVSLISGLYFFLIAGVLMPYLNKGSSSGLLLMRYSHLGGSIIEIVKNMVLNPFLILKQLVSLEKFFYLVVLVLPFVFLPFLSLDVFLISLPSLLINLLSKSSAMHFPFHFYYSGSILAFLCVATISSLEKIRRKGKVKFRNTVFRLLVASIAMSFFYSPAAYSLNSSLKDYRVSEHARRIGEIYKLIPRDASLSVQNNLGAHFSKRKYIYTFPFQASEANYVLMDVYDANEIIRFYPRQLNFIFSTQLFLEDYEKLANEMFELEDYGVYYFSEDGYLIFKRGEGREKNSQAKAMFERNFQEICYRYEGYSKYIERIRSGINN